MRRIALLSDTHGHIDDTIYRHCGSCDELWHAGDIGSLEVLETLEQFRPVRAVFGNVDGEELRRVVPEDLDFECEGARIFITHIGGYPGRYAPRVRKILEARRPELYVCGHSHILKIERDPKLGLLHVNPGACGRQGLHRVKTLVRFELEAGKISGMEVVEWPR